ncbi:hypothetical protein HKCCE2091_21655 [Rhodobacterales bacterium HKCCE2091]|nr:hypothetical protein [Rhodobacterales bacterium HKCCE2091]
MTPTRHALRRRPPLIATLAALAAALLDTRRRRRQGLAFRRAMQNPHLARDLGVPRGAEEPKRPVGGGNGW